MCLLVIAWRLHPHYRLVVAANRDEFHDRPAAPLAKWPAPDEILAGRDLRAHGTWLGMDQQRRFGVVTNFRELRRPRPEAPSRGALIPDYLRDSQSAEQFVARLQPQASQYSGFNLLLTDGNSLWYASNRAAVFARPLAPGVYGLSNEFLDTPWPKLRRVRQRFEGWMGESLNEPVDSLFDLLDDRTPVPEDAFLPQSGLPLEWERVLSAPFVLHPEYGTRASTVVLLEPSGAARLAERRFDAQGARIGQTDITLAAGEWP